MLLCPPPGDFPDPGIESKSLKSPAVAGGFFTTTITREDVYWYNPYKKSMEIPQKIKTRTTIRSRNPSSMYKSKGNKKMTSKGYLHSHYYCILYIGQDIEATYVSMNKWIKKNKILFSHKNKGNTSVCANYMMIYMCYIEEQKKKAED